MLAAINGLARGQYAGVFAYNITAGKKGYKRIVYILG